jgi:hypothetical protein
LAIVRKLSAKVYFCPVNLLITLAAANIPKVAVTVTTAPKPPAQSSRVPPSIADLL